MSTLETGRDRSVRLAGLSTYARLFEEWSQVRHRAVLSAYQLGCLRDRRTPWRRRRPPVPLLQLLVEPGGPVDFADPETGFPGLADDPDPGRVLTLWADDLLSVRHRDDWIYVVEGAHPFAGAWLDLVSVRGGPARPGAVVTAAFGGPAPLGVFAVADVDATTYSTRVRVEDRRGEVPAPRTPRRRVPGPRGSPPARRVTGRAPGSSDAGTTSEGDG